MERDHSAHENEAGVVLTGARLIDLVREGMDVFDNSGEKIGSVDDVKSGDPRAATGMETGVSGGLLDDLARAFGFRDELELAPELRERYLRLGFLKVDAKGLFEADRYVLADKISSVISGCVYLNIPKQRLASAP